MWFKLLVLLAPLAFGLNQTGDVITEDGQLVTVVVIYRHGDRTPVEPYPNDPWKNPTNWPVGFGQLTNLGKLEHYNLGQWLRTRYTPYLPATYNERDIYVRSTDVDRTLMSAEANLAGLYPPTSSEIWDDAIRWQPVPVHTRPEMDDATLAMKAPCDRYSVLLKEVLAGEPFATVDRENQALYEYLTAQTGGVVDSIEQLEYLYNTLFIEELYNKTLPEWTRRVYPDKLKPTADLSFATACFTTQLARLKTGPFFHELLGHLFNVTQVQSRRRGAGGSVASGTRKMWVYSGHDTTIANILNALGLFEYHSPPYASTILFELRHLNNNHYVNILYKNTTQGARLLTLPGCHANCPLADFVRLVDPLDVTPARWSHECQVSFWTVLPFTTLQNVVIISCSAVFLLLLVSMVVGVLVTRSRVGQEQREYLRLPDSDDVTA